MAIKQDYWRAYDVGHAADYHYQPLTEKEAARLCSVR